jgi:hypothetical protein
LGMSRVGPRVFRRISSSLVAKGPRSYLGICSCCLFAIAAACVIAWIASNWNARYKLAGLDGIVVIPFALALNLVGCLAGYLGAERPDENPLSRIGMFLNLVPLLFVAIVIAFSIVVQIGIGR